MKIQSLFQFAIYMYMIAEVILSNKWIEGINNASALVGCHVQLHWKLFGDHQLVSNYKISGNDVEYKLANSEKYHIDTTHFRRISITINNITMDDAGIYRCRDNDLTDQWADLYLTVTDMLWKDNPTVVSVLVGDDVSLTWEYFINDIDQHKSVYKQPLGTTDDDQGKWENEKLIVNGDDPRMRLNITESDDGRTEVVKLTIHNTSIEDFNFIYNMEIQFNHNCVRYAEPISLIEVVAPRVSSLKTELAGRPSENITFVWTYRYSAVATSAVFNIYNDLHRQVRIGYWIKNRFESNIGENRLLFDKLAVFGGENIILTILKSVDDDFNTIYGCNITFSDGLSGYNETKLIFTQDVGPRMKVPDNQQMHGKIGDMIALVFTYYYSFPAIGINISRKNSSGFKYEHGEVTWKNVYSVIEDDRLIFHNRSILGGGHISLIILNTTSQDYDAIYKCEVMFTNDKIVSAMIELILQYDTAPSVSSLKTELAGRPSENITFVWTYRYSAVATSAVFNIYNDLRRQVRIGYWINNRFESKIGEHRLLFGKQAVFGGENIILTILKSVDEDFNIIYGCNITFSNGLSGYNETKLIFTQDVGPRMKVPDNQQMHGKIGDMIALVFTYYYSFPAIGINISRTNSSGFKYEPGKVTWKNVYSVIEHDRLIFHNRSILGGGHISLIILNTTSQDYDAIYKCEVIFTNDKIVSAVIELILQNDTVMPEKEKTTTVERSLMIASLILIVLTCFIIGIVVHSRRRKSPRPGPTGNTTNDSNHSYISMNSAVVFNANRRSTATPTESTSSNDTDAYANPYDPINRDGIDTTKNFYMPLRNPGTSDIDQSDVVQETNVEGNLLVTNIDDVQIADNDGDTSTHETTDDDDTSTHDFNRYDALNKCTMHNDVHSYMSLPPCTRPDLGKNDLSPNSSIVDGIIVVKKRPSTI